MPYGFAPIADTSVVRESPYLQGLEVLYPVRLMLMPDPGAQTADGTQPAQQPVQSSVQGPAPQQQPVVPPQAMPAQQQGPQPTAAQ